MLDSAYFNFFAIIVYATFSWQHFIMLPNIFYISLNTVFSILVHDIIILPNAISYDKSQFLMTWVKVFRIIPEFRILRMTFHRKSSSKC